MSQVLRVWAEVTWLPLTIAAFLEYEAASEWLVCEPALKT
jgi:hypothetical protein